MPTAIYFDGANGVVELTNDTTLNSKWTFSGECIVNGNGKILDLDETGELVVEDGSQLTLKDLCIHNIKAEKIRCLDDAGIILLDNVQWLQDCLYTFSHGSMQMKNAVSMSGTGTFAYQTCCTSTVLELTHWKLDHGFTFSYDPVVVTSKELLAFVDGTSVLALNNAQFHTNEVGIHLKKGAIEIKRDCCFSSNVVISDDIITDIGITIGDQTPANDFNFSIANGGICRIAQGSLNYKNVAIDSWNMANEISTLSIMPQATLRVFENLDLGIGRLEMNKSAYLEVASGKQITGSIFDIGS